MTTAHPREDLHRFVNQLNVRYNIGVPIPDPYLSLSDKRDDQTPASRIYRRLEIHFYTGGVNALNGLLRVFDDKAKHFWSKWVKKPEADRDTLPVTLQPPLAANLSERDWLQNIFNKILDTAQPAMQESRSLARSQSGPAAIGQAAPGKSSRASTRPDSNASKRRAEAQLGDLSKKTRADHESDPIKVLTAQSSLHRRQQVDRIASASATGAMCPPRTHPSTLPGGPNLCYC